MFVAKQVKLVALALQSHIEPMSGDMHCLLRTACQQGITRTMATPLVRGCLQRRSDTLLAAAMHATRLEADAPLSTSVQCVCNPRRRVHVRIMPQVPSDNTGLAPGAGVLAAETGPSCERPGMWPLRLQVKHLCFMLCLSHLRSCSSLAPLPPDCQPQPSKSICAQIRGARQTR